MYIRWWESSELGFASHLGILPKCKECKRWTDLDSVNT